MVLAPAPRRFVGWELANATTSDLRIFRGVGWLEETCANERGWSSGRIEDHTAREPGSGGFAQFGSNVVVSRAVDESEGNRRTRDHATLATATTIAN